MSEDTEENVTTSYPTWTKYFTKIIKDTKDVKHFEVLDIHRYSKDQWLQLKNKFLFNILEAFDPGWLPPPHDHISPKLREHYDQYLKATKREQHLIASRFDEVWSSYYANSYDDIKEILLKMDLNAWVKTKPSAIPFLHLIVNKHSKIETTSWEFCSNPYDFEMYEDLRSVCTYPWFVDFDHHCIYFSYDENGNEIDRTNFKLIYGDKWMK